MQSTSVGTTPGTEDSTLKPSTAVEIDIRVGEATHRILFRCPTPVLARTPESVLALSLIPCMSRGVPVVIDEPVSARMLDSVPVIQQILASWTRTLKVVDVIAERTTFTTAGERVGMFFSGGVDSWFTFLRHREEITDLVFIHGHDIELEDGEARTRAAAAVREIAAETGRNLIEVESGIKKLPFRDVGWQWTNGAALATIAHLLSSQFRRFYFPSSSYIGALLPWGSHPHLDPRWSTEVYEFIHADADVSRVEKTRAIAESPLALRTLRVCWERPDEYNCGRCEKCVRTMVALRAARALDRCKTFSTRLTPWRAFRGTTANWATLPYIRSNLAALDPKQDRWLMLAVEAATFLQPIKDLFSSMRRTLRLRSRFRRFLDLAGRP